MPALDFPENATAGGGGTDALDPSVQAMRAARRQAMLNDALRNAQMEREQAAEDRANAAAERETHTDTVRRQAAQAQADAAQWMMPQRFPDNPDAAYNTANPYRTDYYHAPAEAQEHFSAYPPEVQAEMPKIWNEAASSAAGRPVGVGNLPGNAVATTDVNGVKVTLKPPSRTLRTLAAQRGVNVADLPEDATDDEINAAIAAKEAEKQETRDTAGKAAQTSRDARIRLQVRRQIGMGMRQQPVQFYRAAKANYDSIQANVAQKNRTGADDMALIQALATIEAPGRSPTHADVALALRTAGMPSGVETTAGRIMALFNQSPDAQAKAGRLITDEVAQQMARTARRSVIQRRRIFDDAVAPLIDMAEEYKLPEGALSPDVYHDEFSDEADRSTDPLPEQPQQPNTQQPGQPTENDQAALQWYKDPANGSNPARPIIEQRLRAVGLIH